ncbi:hypothetical protein M1B74_13560 [Bacteroides pyogenes]|uniref:hypothetical protein n=1 Tax=Bacteroides pyogenes TaxID=310300 RepID=UPI003B437837
MKDSLTHENIQTELSILYAKLQVYYLMQIYLCRKHDTEKAQIFKARLKQLQDSEMEEKQQNVSIRTLHTICTCMKKYYSHELEVVDRILEQHPTLFLMKSEQIMEILEKEAKDYELQEEHAN